MLKVTDARFREDLSPVIDVLMLKEKDMSLFSFVTFLRNNLKVTHQKHEWYDDAPKTESITSGTSGSGLLWDGAAVTASLPINSSDIAKLQVGDVLQLGLPAQPSQELVIVKSINTSANTIDVWARGACGTTGTAQGTSAFTITIVGRAQVEDSDPIADSFQSLTACYNYSQVFEDVAGVSGSVMRSTAITGDNMIDFQVVKKLKELLRTLNNTILNGGRAYDATNKIGSMGGLKRTLTTTSNVGGSLTLAKLYTAVTANITAGGTPSSIHASAKTIGTIEQLFAGYINQRPDTQRMGLTVKSISMLGLDIALFVDRHILDAEAYILDDSRISFGPLNGDGMYDGKFSSYPLFAKRNGKQYATQVLGEYTLEIRQAAAAGVRAYGIS
jgi:hypothetical protein